MCKKEAVKRVNEYRLWEGEKRMAYVTNVEFKLARGRNGAGGRCHC